MKTMKAKQTKITVIAFPSISYLIAEVLHPSFSDTPCASIDIQLLVGNPLPSFLLQHAVVTWRTFGLNHHSELFLARQKGACWFGELQVPGNLAQCLHAIWSQVALLVYPAMSPNIQPALKLGPLWLTYVIAQKGCAHAILVLILAGQEENK